VTDEMVGYKVGEFIRTMKPWHYKGEAEPPF
jgi:ribosomal protein S19